MSPLTYEKVVEQTPAVHAVPPNISTVLAFERTRAAYDRTLMAWMRTATSMISFGFTIYKFFQIEMDRAAHPARIVGPREFALTMVGLGVLSMLFGTIEHWENLRELHAQGGEGKWSKTGLIAGLVSMLGIAAIVLMLFRQ
jgi:putative membrane protein